MNEFSELDNLLDGWGDGNITSAQADAGMDFLNSLDGLESELSAMKVAPPAKSAPLKSANPVSVPTAKVTPVVPTAAQSVPQSVPQSVAANTLLTKSNSGRPSQGQTPVSQYKVEPRNLADNARLTTIYKICHGIRHAVGRKSSSNPVPPSPKDVKKREKFAMSRTSASNPAKFDYEFTEYADTIFAQLRRSWGTEPADYMLSWTTEYLCLDEEVKSSKGNLIYVTPDRQYVIKSISKAERQFLQKNLQSYADYMRQNESSLLVKITGLYEVDSQSYLVMENIFPTSIPFTKYELRGENARSASAVLTDKDLPVLVLPEASIALFRTQLQADIKLIGGWGSAGYCLLLASFDPSSAATPLVLAKVEGPEGDRPEFRPSSSRPRKSSFQKDNGGLASGQGLVYCLSLVDFLNDSNAKSGRKLTLKRSKSSIAEDGPEAPVYAKEFEKGLRKLFTPFTPSDSSLAIPEKKKKQKKSSTRSKGSDSPLPQPSRTESPKAPPREIDVALVQTKLTKPDSKCLECGDPARSGQTYCDLCQADRALGDLSVGEPKPSLSRAEHAAELAAIGQVLKTTGPSDDLDTMMEGLQATSVDDALGELFGKRPSSAPAPKPQAEEPREMTNIERLKLRQKEREEAEKLAALQKAAETRARLTGKKSTGPKPPTPIPSHEPVAAPQKRGSFVNLSETRNEEDVVKSDSTKHGWNPEAEIGAGAARSARALFEKQSNKPTEPVHRASRPEPPVQSGTKFQPVTVAEVAALVRTVDPTLYNIFSAQKIDGKTFLALDADDLRGLVPTLGDRKKVRKLIDESLLLPIAVDALPPPPSVSLPTVPRVATVEQPSPVTEPVVKRAPSPQPSPPLPSPPSPPPATVVPPPLPSITPEPPVESLDDDFFKDLVDVDANIDDMLAEIDNAAETTELLPTPVPEPQPLPQISVAPLPNPATEITSVPPQSVESAAEAASKAKALERERKIQEQFERAEAFKIQQALEKEEKRQKALAEEVAERERSAELERQRAEAKAIAEKEEEERQKKREEEIKRKEEERQTREEAEKARVAAAETAKPESKSTEEMTDDERRAAALEERRRKLAEQQAERDRKLEEQRRKREDAEAERQAKIEERMRAQEAKLREREEMARMKELEKERKKKEEEERKEAEEEARQDVIVAACTALIDSLNPMTEEKFLSKQSGFASLYEKLDTLPEGHTAKAFLGEALKTLESEGAAACREAAEARQNEKARVDAILAQASEVLPELVNLITYRACRDQLPALSAQISTLPGEHRSKLESRVKELNETGQRLEKEEQRRVVKILESARDIVEEAEDGLDLGLYLELKPQMQRCLADLETLPSNLAVKAVEFKEKIQALERQGIALQEQENARLAAEEAEKLRLAEIKKRLEDQKRAEQQRIERESFLALQKQQNSTAVPVPGRLEGELSSWCDSSLDPNTAMYCKKLFAENGVSRDDLKELSSSDLTEMGFAEGPRRKLLAALGRPEAGDSVGTGGGLQRELQMLVALTKDIKAKLVPYQAEAYLTSFKKLAQLQKLMEGKSGDKAPELAKLGAPILQAGLSVRTSPETSATFADALSNYARAVVALLK